MAAILDEHKEESDSNVLRRYDPAYVLSFVGQSLNKNLKADLAEVGATMSPAGPDRSGMFFMAQMMEAQREYEEEKRSKEVQATTPRVEDGK
eukprot:m.21238 g.21238  ORF g.21238 m.21238 type:complete len:92 (+) comp11119_c0_seq1:672-947(+)